MLFASFGSPYVSNLVASSVHFLFPRFICTSSLVAWYPFEGYLFNSQSVYVFPHSNPYVNERAIDLEAMVLAFAVFLNVVEVVCDDDNGW